MSTATSYAPITPDDLLSMPDGDRYELVDGQLTEETRIVEVHRIDGSVSKLHVVDDLTGGEVLPGFCCHVGDLFNTADIMGK